MWGGHGVPPDGATYFGVEPVGRKRRACAALLIHLVSHMPL